MLANCPADTLICKGGKIKFTCLPKTSAILHFLDRGINHTFKVSFRCEFRLFVSSYTEVTEFLNNTILKNVSYSVGPERNAITSNAVINCWKDCVAVSVLLTVCTD